MEFLVCLSAHHGALCTRGEEAAVQAKLGGPDGGHSPDPASLVLFPLLALGLAGLTPALGGS